MEKIKTDIKDKDSLMNIKNVNTQTNVVVKPKVDVTRVEIAVSKPQKTSFAPKFRSPFTSFGKKRIDIAFGMDISDTSIELLEFKPFFSHYPRAYSRINLEKDIVERGIILNKQILEDKIRALLKGAKPTKVSTNRVILSLPEAQTFTWSTALNKSVSGGDLKKMILEEAKKNIPLDFKKIYWDYLVYPLKQKELQYVTFVGISQEVLDAYVEVCNNIGLEVVEFSLINSSLARTFLPPSDKDDYILLDIGGQSSNISIIGGNTLLKLSFTINFGGDAITKSIAKALNVPEIEAEQLKLKFGISDGPSSAYRPAVEEVLNNLLNQAKTAINFYEKKSGETVDAIYLIGGSSLLLGLDSYVSKYLGKELHSLVNLPFISKSQIFNKEINLKLFANAVGLALLGVTKVDSGLSFRKQIVVPTRKKGFFAQIGSGYFSPYRMIFSYTHVVYSALVLLVLILGTIFTLMWLELK